MKVASVRHFYVTGMPSNTARGSESFKALECHVPQSSDDGVPIVGFQGLDRVVNGAPLRGHMCKHGINFIYRNLLFHL